MNDFGTHLSTLLDDVAAGIDPQPDFDAVRAATVPVVTSSGGGGGGGRFRGALGVAAAAVALLGGGVAAYHVAVDEPTSVVTSSELTDTDEEPGAVATTIAEQPDAVDDRPDPVERVNAVPAADDRPTPTDVAEHDRLAELGDTKLVDGVIHQLVHGRAAPGEFVSAVSDHGSTVVAAAADGSWELVVKLTDVPADGAAHLRVGFARSDVVFEFEVKRPSPSGEPKAEEAKPEQPKPEEPKAEQPKPEQPEPEQPKPEQPKPEPEQPEPIAFTVNLTPLHNDATHMKQVFYGTAPAGAVVYAKSSWGSTHVVAGDKGGWELHLVLADVPDGTVVHVTVSANTGGAHEYDLVRDKPAVETIAFTSQLGEGYLGHTPMKQILYGRGQPGSVVVAATEYGSADAVVGPKGHWEMALKMYEVPAGTKVDVRVTNNKSESVYEYRLTRPAAEPEPIDFTAEAAFEECDSNPPFNEYWGRSTAGATITISSPYGGKQVTADGDGHWEARVEFPAAPYGETFDVKVTSSKGSAVYKFPLTRIGPA